MKIYLNVRNGLKKETKDRMKALCKEKSLTFAGLLNETFA